MSAHRTRGRDPRTGEPSITVTVRIRGDRDIAVWQALCFVESQRSCRVAARLIQDAIERAGRDDGVQDLARLLLRSRGPRLHLVPGDGGPGADASAEADPEAGVAMASLSARGVHVQDQVLAVLDAEAPLPVSTSTVLARAGLGESDRAEVLRALNRLAGHERA